MRHGATEMPVPQGQPGISEAARLSAVPPVDWRKRPPHTGAHDFREPGAGDFRCPWLTSTELMNSHLPCWPCPVRQAQLGDFDGFPGPAQARQTVGHHRRHRQGARAQRPAATSSAGRRRAGLRHARQHQGAAIKAIETARHPSTPTSTASPSSRTQSSRSSSARTASTTSQARSPSAPAASRCCTMPLSRRSIRATR